jgi:hypothetical protein
MTLGQNQQAFARDLVKLLQQAFESGYEVRVGEVLRTPEQQALYMQTGRSKTMNSMHLKKCAADLHFFKDGQLCYPPELGKFWESLSPSINRWGGNFRSFKDEPHFERQS